MSMGMILLVFAVPALLVLGACAFFGWLIYKTRLATAYTLGQVEATEALIPRIEALRAEAERLKKKLLSSVKLSHSVATEKEVPGTLPEGMKMEEAWELTPLEMAVSRIIISHAKGDRMMPTVEGREIMRREKSRNSTIISTILSHTMRLSLN